MDEAAYAASVVVCQVPGLAYQGSIADSRQPTRPAEITTDLGNLPRLSSRHRVVLENEVTVNTSFSRMNRSSFLSKAAPLRFFGISLCRHGGSPLEWLALLPNSAASLVLARRAVLYRRCRSSSAGHAGGSPSSAGYGPW